MCGVALGGNKDNSCQQGEGNKCGTLGWRMTEERWGSNLLQFPQLSVVTSSFEVKRKEERERDI